MPDHVLLLAGWGTDRARLHPLRDHLATSLGASVRIQPYEPDVPLRTLAGRLASELADGPTAPRHLVGHSLGGLVAASAVLDHDVRVASVTTVNTPWRGTWVGWTGDSRLANELRWGSAELDRLRSGLREHLRRDDGPRWRVIGVLGDLATPPTTSLRAPGGRRLSRRLVWAVGHSVSLLRPALHDAVAGTLEDRRTRPIGHP